MTALPLLPAGTALLALFAVAPAAAQFVPQPTPTADALAAQMRQLAATPRDVYALIAAGELSTKLGDPSAAMGFFARASAVEPTNPRIVAGRAGALVLLERPGEALQLYAQAERAGVAMTPYLAQRGLAYDLTGQPGYAQRDYRRALAAAPDDETVRRLALSLGISGRRDEAFALLDPLLRRSDRAAWRARACILAMSGDVAGAQQIAASMMSGGAALSPFFGRLQLLSPVDRAFAVHFGEVAGSPARTADARLAPVMAALPADPQPQPSATAVAARETRVTDRRDPRRRRSGREPVAVAAAAPTPAPTAPAPSPAVPVRDPASVVAAAQPLPPRQPVPSAVSMQGSAALASTTPTTLAPTRTTTRWAMTADAPPPAAVTQRSDTPPVEIVTLPRQPSGQVAAAPPPPPRPVPAPTPTPAPSPPAERVAVGDVVQPPPATPASAAAASEVPASARVEASTTPPVTEQSPASPPPQTRSAPTPAARTPEVARRNTQLLASIIDTIAVPASELDVAAPSRPARRSPEAPPPAAKAAESKRVAAKPDLKKPEPRKPDPAKAEPPRWWVQVAGGANAADLGKDWKRLTAKSPAAFHGRTAYSTPLRATNRLLAGPFKSQGEAAAFVNTLAKDGASAFAWQSEAGRKIERLSPK